MDASDTLTTHRRAEDAFLLSLCSHPFESTLRLLKKDNKHLIPRYIATMYSNCLIRSEQLQSLGDDLTGDVLERVAQTCITNGLCIDSIVTMAISTCNSGSVVSGISEGNEEMILNVIEKIVEAETYTDPDYKYSCNIDPNDVVIDLLSHVHKNKPDSLRKLVRIVAGKYELLICNALFRCELAWDIVKELSYVSDLDEAYRKTYDWGMMSSTIKGLWDKLRAEDV